MKIKIIIILGNFLLSQLLDDSMNINYIPTSVNSSGMGGIYIPHNIDNEINFSHLSRFGGIYRLDAIQYNNILFTAHGVSDIVNTTQAWTNIDGDGPAANEIDYSKISYFDVKDYNITISKIIKNKYNISIKGTLSENYNRYGFGLGLNIVTTKREYKWFDYYLGIYDMLSFKIWPRDGSFLSSSSCSDCEGYLEFYEPKIMVSLERRFLKSLNVLTLYGMYKDADGESTVDYRFGSKITLTDNIDIFLGKSRFKRLSFGFSISNQLFNIDYSYIISADDLPFDNSYNIGLGININQLIEKGGSFHP